MGDRNKVIAITINIVGMIVGIFIMSAGIIRFIYADDNINAYILGTYLVFVSF